MARKVKFDFNPFSQTFSGVRLKGEKRQRALDEIKEFVLEQVLAKVGSSNSPVSGQSRFRRLSSEYRKEKLAEGGSGQADLELTGALLDSLKINELRGSTLRLTVDSDQQPKADGHNNFSGKSELPRRAFIPDADKNEKFKADIMQGINRIVRRFSEDG